MTVHNIKYGTPTSLTITLASLAASASHIAGRESTEVHNDAASTQFPDVSLEGFITVGTTPTVDTSIKVYVWGSHTSLGIAAKDVLDGTDSNETFNSEGVKQGVVVLAATLIVDETVSDQTYYFGPLSVAQLFGQMPEYWGVWVAHDTGVNLNSTGSNHEIKYTPIEYESV